MPASATLIPPRRDNAVTAPIIATRILRFIGYLRKVYVVAPYKGVRSKGNHRLQGERIIRAVSNTFGQEEVQIVMVAFGPGLKMYLA